MGTDDKKSLFKTSNFHTSVTESIAPRTILHVDGNAFFASCETTLHPEYASVPMAVCGSVEDRHGIVLAKNDLAKSYGIKTAETVWQAKRKCPELLTVRPTYGLYSEMSRRMNEIFYDYTDLVEPFGLDESWLDVTGSLRLFGDGRAIADSIRERVKSELGITVSVGVSFNKVFAKLGSDMKKPDATSVIPPDRFASIVWPLPVSSLLFVGPSCARTLGRLGIDTIGDLACCNESLIASTMGKNGLMLRDFARGRDFAEVTRFGYEPDPKSVSNGMTFRENLSSKADISFATTYLSMSVAERLRKHGLCCRSVSVGVRKPDQTSFTRTSILSHPSCLAREISDKAMTIIDECFGLDSEFYSLTICAEKLVREGENELQQSLFPSESELSYRKLYSLESTVDSIRSRFGNKSIGIATALKNRLIGT